MGDVPHSPHKKRELLGRTSQTADRVLRGWILQSKLDKRSRHPRKNKKESKAQKEKQIIIIRKSKKQQSSKSKSSSIGK